MSHPRSQPEPQLWKTTVLCRVPRAPCTTRTHVFRPKLSEKQTFFLFSFFLIRMFISLYLGIVVLYPKEILTFIF